MSQKNYDIKTSYTHRKNATYFDDTELQDEWQKEVYLKALSLMQEHNLERVYDVGCGSGYKLINYLGMYNTIGFDVPQTVEFLRKAYPNRAWEISNFKLHNYPPAPIVICSDVIEHVEEPDDLMSFLMQLSNDWIVLSTPDRELVYPVNSKYLDGPPANAAHLREWNFTEFKTYIKKYLYVVEHFISNELQATQVIVGRVRRPND